MELLLSIAAPFGTLLAAFAAFYTLKEIKKQRESSYQPEITPENKSDIYIYFGSNRRGIVDRPLEDVPNSSNLAPNFPRIGLLNFGLGPAKEVKIEFTIKLSQLIYNYNNWIRELDLPQTKIHTHNDLLNIEYNDHFHVQDLLPNHRIHSQFISNIQPIHLLDQNLNLAVPMYYYNILTLHFHLFRTKQISEMLEWPELRVDITYKDMGGKNFNRTFKLKFQYLYSGSTQLRGQIIVQSSK